MPEETAQPSEQDASTLVHPTDDVPERALVVVAHPDDCDFGSAGTVAIWTAKGARISYCIITNGAAGSADPTVDLSKLVHIREEEQRAAAAAVGVDDVVFLGYPDGQLTPSIDVRRDIARQIRRVRPDRVISQSPERNFTRIRASHPDHLAAGEAALDAVYPDARNPYAFPELLSEEGLEPFEVPEVWLMATPTPTRYVDITDHINDKISALLCHKTQIAKPDDLATMIRGWAGDNGRRAGLPEGGMAEAFQVVDTR